MERTRVLVVDDSAQMRSSVKDLLESLGYDVETARGGAEALAAHRKRRVAIVITAIFMPEMDGIETIAKFKAGWPKVRVIAMSGGGRVAKKTYLREALQVGADATLRKPFSLQALRAALARDESVVP
jgi:CheY-like chemotaxis protein